MRKTILNKAIVSAAVLFALHFASSCVNEKYEISKDKLDLNVTGFREGVSLPLGSTAKVRLDSIINMLELDEEIMKYLLAGEDHAYSIFYKSDEPYDASEQLQSLSGLVDIDKIDFSQKVDFSLKSLDVSSVSYAGGTFGVSEDISESFDGFAVKIDPFTEEFSIDAKVREFNLDNVSWEVDLGDHNANPVFAELPGISVPEALRTGPNKDTEYSINDINTLLGEKKIALKTQIEGAELQANIAHPFPEEVESVSDIHLAEGAKLKVTVQMVDPFFSSGSMVPHVDINFGSFMHLANESGKVHDDHIDMDFILNEGNGWKAEGEYDITGLVLDPANDWRVGPNADGVDVLWFDKAVNLEASGALTDSDLKTTPALLGAWLERHPGRHQLEVNVTMEFVDFNVDDVTMKFKPIAIEREELFDIDIPSIKLPEEAKKVENVRFDDASGIDFVLSAQNVANLGDVDLNVTELELTFPDELEVEGAVGGKLIIPGANLSDGNISRTIKVKSFDLKEPGADGRIPAYTAEVKVLAKAEVSGEVHTANLPAVKEDDISLHGDIVGHLQVADYDVTVKGYSIDSSTNPDLFKTEEIKIEIPEDVAQIQGLSIILKNSPAIAVTFDIPDVSFDIRPIGANGLVAKFPEMIRLKKGGYPYESWYDEAKHALVFPSDKDLPEELLLPLDCIVVNPKKDLTDGKYYSTGVFEVTGAVGVLDNVVIKKADVDILSQPGTAISFQVEVPKLEPQTVNMSSYTTQVDTAFVFKPLDGVELPDELVNLEEIVFDDVYMSFGLNTGAGFPAIGDDASLSLGVDLTLPEFIKIDDSRFNNGTLSISGRLEKASDGSMSLEIEPIKLASLDLGMSREDLSKLEGKIGLSGNVSLSGAALTVDEWVGKDHSIDIVADIKTIRPGSGATDKLEIKKVSGNLDYQIDPVEMNVGFSGLADYLEGDNLSAIIDLSTFYVLLDLNTNLGVPVKAGLELTPFYGANPGETVKKEIEIACAESSAEIKNTKLWISKDAPAVSGEEYQHLDLDILSMLYKDEQKTELLDSLKVMFTGGTDPELTSVYEPSTEYTLTLDYAVGVPLAFDEHFEIVYRDSIADLPEVVGMLMEYGGRLGLGGEIESSLPFNMSLVTRLLDSEGNLVAEAVVDEPFIKSADRSGNAVTTVLDLLIEPCEGVDVSDIASVEFEFKADTRTAPGVPLREDSYIKVNKLFARVPDGVSLDLGDFIFDDEEEGDNE